MLNLTREEFMKEPVWHKLYELIKRNHRPAEHTKNIIWANRTVKDFCETAFHFTVIPASPKYFYVGYEVDTWFSPPCGFKVSIREICIYDDELEYKIARDPKLNVN